MRDGYSVAAMAALGARRSTGFGFGWAGTTG